MMASLSGTLATMGCAVPYAIGAKFAVPYARYAELIGLHGIRVEDPEQVSGGWEQALAADRPVVYEVVTDPEVPPLPPHITLDQAASFRLGDRPRRRRATPDGRARAAPAPRRAVAAELISVRNRSLDSASRALPAARQGGITSKCPRPASLRSGVEERVANLHESPTAGKRFGHRS
jgi:hypothetical protein